MKWKIQQKKEKTKNLFIIMNVHTTKILYEIDLTIFFFFKPFIHSEFCFVSFRFVLLWHIIFWNKTNEKKCKEKVKKIYLFFSILFFLVFILLWLDDLNAFLNINQIESNLNLNHKTHHSYKMYTLICNEWISILNMQWQFFAFAFVVYVSLLYVVFIFLDFR